MKNFLFMGAIWNSLGNFGIYFILLSAFGFNLNYSATLEQKVNPGSMLPQSELNACST